MMRERVLSGSGQTMRRMKDGRRRVKERIELKLKERCPGRSKLKRKRRAGRKRDGEGGGREGY
jgi:hypothetical protein